MSFPTSDCRALTQQVVTTAPNTNAFLWKETFTSKSPSFSLLLFLSFILSRSERKLVKRTLSQKKQKGKQTLLRDVLHKGVWGRQALSKGKDQKTCRGYKRPSQGLDKSKSSSVEILKAKIPMFFSDFPEKDLHIFRRGNICFKNFHSLFDGPTCLNKHYRSIHGAAILRGRPFYDFLQKMNKGLIFLCLHFLIHSLAFCSTR